MRTSIRRFASQLLVLAMCPFAVQAIPVTYSFSTGNPIAVGDPTLVPLFSGLTVNGTFEYDSAATGTTGTVPAGFPTTGATIYFNSTANLSGSVGTNSFSDALGRTIVGNDVFGGINDFLALNADPLIGSPAPPSEFGFIGFDIAGFTLVNVRMFWIENLIAGAPDFLPDQNLPGALPGLVGRLALDFTPTASPGALSPVFFDGLTVTRVPEPTTLSLLALGLLGLAFRRRPHST